MASYVQQTKGSILHKIQDYQCRGGLNRMGCSEDYYDPYFCMGETFTAGELGAMTEQELNNLCKLAEFITGALY